MASLKPMLCALTLAFSRDYAQTPPSAPAAQPALPAPVPSSAAAPVPIPEPGITQIRKSVAFLKLHCADDGKEYDVRGTGFFVFYPDSRIGEGFAYLVTNRHVAMCWNEHNHPMQVKSISMTLNRKEAQGDNFAQEGFLTDSGNISWILPDDESVDLAVFPLAPDQTRFDFKFIPMDMFVSTDFLKQHRVVEGEPVFFAGFFYQFPGSKRMEPIVRQGIVAMMPSDKVPFVGMAERVYLADLHAFGGNSGSPAFVNLGGFHGGNIYSGDNYRLLGVVNAEVTEDVNFNLELTTTLQGTGKANSGISTIVPADELKALLDGPRVQKLRDAAVVAKGLQPSPAPVPK